MIPLLILRPQPGASATAKRAEARGMSPLVHPLFAVAPIAWDAPDPTLFDAVLLTSANAVRHGGERLCLYCNLPAYAVGVASARAARDAGFATVIEGSVNVTEALHALAAAGHSRPLHLSGENRTAYPPLPFAIATRSVYAARPLAVALSQTRCVALLHSVRAAARFAELCPTRQGVDLVAISAAVARAAGRGWRSIATAPTPDDNAMLALAAPLCDGAAIPTGPR